MNLPSTVIVPSLYRHGFPYRTTVAFSSPPLGGDENADGTVPVCGGATQLHAALEQYGCLIRVHQNRLQVRWPENRPEPRLRVLALRYARELKSLVVQLQSDQIECAQLVWTLKKAAPGQSVWVRPGLSLEELRSLLRVVQADDAQRANSNE